MFANIRKHQKWLWIVISTLVIISFVWYFNPQSKYNRRSGVGGGDDRAVGTAYGEPLPRSKYFEIQREAMLAHLFQYGEWPQNDEASRRLNLLDRQLRQRLIFLHKIKDFDIQVGDDAVADWFLNSPAFKDPQTKAFNKEGYERFKANLPRQGLTQEDLQRYARHQIAIEHLAALISIPGKLVTPSEAEKALREEKEKVDTKAVFFTASNYVAQIEIKPEAIGQFYTNRASAYRLPERVQLSYVIFPASNYFAQAEQSLAKETNLTQQIDAMYTQRGPNFYTDEKGQVMAPEAAKAKIRQELVEDTAKLEARRAATTFIEKVIAATNLPPATRLEQVAQQEKLTPQVTEPFGQFESPKGLNVPDQFGKIAFMLTPEEPVYEEPVVGEDAVYALAFKQRVPSSLPPLATIQEKVVEDYRNFESQNLARQAGLAFATSVTNALAAGKTFEQAAQEAGLTVVDVAPFSRDARTLPGVEGRADAADFRTTAFATKAGQASSFRRSHDGGYVLLVEKVSPVSPEELKTELPTFVQDLRRRRASEAFENWFQKELMVARLNLPGDKKQGMEGEEATE
jgi:hypothetical protein